MHEDLRALPAVELRGRGGQVLRGEVVEGARPHEPLGGPPGHPRIEPAREDRERPREEHLEPVEQALAAGARLDAAAQLLRYNVASSERRPVGEQRLEDPQRRRAHAGGAVSDSPLDGEELNQANHASEPWLVHVAPQLYDQLLPKQVLE